MAFDNVPWAINGATHTADTMRSAYYAQTGGTEGVTRVGDFKVTALPVPGAAVRIAPGGGTLRNRYPGGAGQSYSPRAGSATDLPVSATGSSGGATRYVIVRIDDPQYGGQGAGGKYVYPTLVNSVTGLDYPFIVLARIDQPANTATITNAMITDLRKVARPQRWTEQRIHALTAGQDSTLSHTGAYPDSGMTWPPAAEAAWGEIPIPEWATRMRLVMSWSGVRAPAGNAFGWTWIQVAPTVNPANVKTQAVRYDTTGSNNSSRIFIMAADERPVPAALRGTSQKFYPRANVDAAVAAGSRLVLDGGSLVKLDVEFLEVAD